MTEDVAAVRPPSILIVDDTPANLQLLSGILKAKGYKVRPVTSGAQALSAAAASTPDLVLLDITMPEMDGFEVCRRMKEMPALRDVPVLFISALSETLDKVHAFAAGGVDYVPKPFEAEEVEARVATHLKLRQLRLELERHNERLEEQVRERTRDLEAANERLRLLDKAKSDFLLLISHELRTPLSGVFGAAELVFDGAGSDPMVTELRALFERSRSRLLTILDDAILLAQVDVLGGTFAPAPVAVSDVLAAARAGATSLSVSRAVTLDPVPPRSGTVLADRELLTKALRSLLETAVKFTSRGGVVGIATRHDPDGGVTVEIRGRGRSVPHEALPRFFDVMAIAEPITPGGDLGLGPPVAERIVSIFGGSVTVANTREDEAAGILFVVTLRAPA